MNLIKSTIMPGISPDLTFILNAYRAHGGRWSPSTPGMSAYLHRCPLMCGPRRDGQLWLDGHTTPMPPGYAADWGDCSWGAHRYSGLILSCLNGCREADILRSIGLARSTSYGLGIGPRTRIMVTRGLRGLTLVA
jgi:hypothetical protein